MTKFFIDLEQSFSWKCIDYWWVLVSAKNGKALAVSCETYHSKQKRNKTAQLVALGFNSKECKIRERFDERNQ